MIVLGVYTGENKLIITIESKTFYFDLPKDINKNLSHEIDFIIKQNEFLAENTTKQKISRLLLPYNDGNDIHEHSKNNEPHKFVFILSQR